MRDPELRRPLPFHFWRSCAFTTTTTDPKTKIRSSLFGTIRESGGWIPEDPASTRSFRQSQEITPPYPYAEKHPVTNRGSHAMQNTHDPQTRRPSTTGANPEQVPACEKRVFPFLARRWSLKNILAGQRIRCGAVF